jgi:hypothetical protein
MIDRCELFVKARSDRISTGWSTASQREVTSQGTIRRRTRPACRLDSSRDSLTVSRIGLRAVLDVQLLNRL